MTVRVAGPIAAVLVSATLATPLTRQEAAPGPCADAITTQLQTWQAIGPPRDGAGVWGDARSRHWPTRTLGTWVTELRPSAAPVLVRASPTGTTRIEWTAGCLPRTDDRPRPAADAPRFTDADLQALVAAGRPGVVYVWSPHMPLSVDGYRALLAAAAPRGVAVHALLEPGADRAFAQASLARGGLPPDALRVADSVELWFRDVHLHAPSILVFAQGRIAGDAWPGYHSAEEYDRFLERALAGQ